MGLADIKRILVAVDFSPHSPKVLKEAVDLADLVGAELTVLNVVHQRLFDELERAGGRFGEIREVATQAVEKIEDERVERLKQMLAKAQAGRVKHHSLITKGLPWQRILEQAEEENSDLIVIGAMGRGAGAAIHGLRFGSSAEKVFRRADCRVLFIR